MALRRLYQGKAGRHRHEMAVAKAEHRMDTAYHNRMLAEVNLRHAQATRTRVAQATSALEHARLMDRVARDVYHARRGRRVSYDEVKHPRNPYGLFVAKGVARRAR